MWEKRNEFEKTFVHLNLSLWLAFVFLFNSTTETFLN